MDLTQFPPIIARSLFLLFGFRRKQLDVVRMELSLEGIVLQLIHSVRSVEKVEDLGGISSRSLENHVRTTGMRGRKLGDVPNFAVQHHPTVVGPVVELDLGQTKNLGHSENKFF